MNMPIETITIVGGGVAAWWVAVHLTRATDLGNKRINVVCPVVNRGIAVGESTVPGVQAAIGRLGFDERDFMIRTDATLKAGTLFKGWDESSGEAQSAFYHPFGQPSDLDISVTASSTSSSFRDSGDRWPALVMGPYGAICDRGLSPRRVDDRPFAGSLGSYAYHLDSGKFETILREMALAEGVQLIEDEVRDVRVRNGNIQAVMCETGQSIGGDLFVDCTGFRSILIEALGGRFVDLTSQLLCDRAIVCRNGGRPERHRPYTTASAMRHGWRWEIDLYPRTGVGYVYSSAFCGDDEAEQELSSYVGEGRDLKTIRMRSGRYNDAWIGNCVAVGLSAGFVEPLEATGLYHVLCGMEHLSENWPSNAGDAQILRKHYNESVGAAFDRTAEFTALHYVLSTRRDTPFWRECTQRERVSESLAKRLDLWRARGPVVRDFGGSDDLFGLPSYLYVLLAKGYCRGLRMAIAGIKDRRVAELLSRRNARKHAGRVGKHLEHTDYLELLRSEE